jgi:hypothetical protein
MKLITNTFGLHAISVGNCVGVGIVVLMLVLLCWCWYCCFDAHFVLTKSKQLVCLLYCLVDTKQMTQTYYIIRNIPRKHFEERSCIRIKQDLKKDLKIRSALDLGIYFNKILDDSFKILQET